MTKWPTMQKAYFPARPGRRECREGALARRGFTLVEVLVALTVLMVLLLVMLVPMNLGLTTTQIGRARAEVQAASQITLNQMEKELRRAVYVFPNTQLPGVTDSAPYNTSPFSGRPYVQLENITDLYSGFAQGVCSAAASPNFTTGNTSRIDFLLPQVENDGSVSTPLKNSRYLVSYYARRLYTNVTPDTYYDAVENPIVLYRAQIPYRDDSDNDFPAIGSNAPASSLNAVLGDSRYPASCASNADVINRGSRWLTQNQFAEPNLEPLANTANGSTPVGSHTLLTPRGMGLVAPFADTVDASVRSFQPTTTFNVSDTNGDGKIDRVAISLELYQYDAGSAAAQAQRVRMPLTINLPNIR